MNRYYYTYKITLLKGSLAGKFIWRFKGDPLNKYKIKSSRPSPEKQKEIMQKIILKLSKPVFNTT